MAGVVFMTHKQKSQSWAGVVFMTHKQKSQSWAGVVFMPHKQKSQSDDWLKFIGSGGWNRTNGLQVMSLTSYHCSTPQYLLQYILIYHVLFYLQAQNDLF